ncbi:MAG: type IV pilus modification protein PilV [Gammaproteobacteria bacterium]|nr:type IV pilus modification protein PilV [Gammaproteobacteria bacterium]
MDRLDLNHATQRQHGFSLAETLIALFVLAIGLLGLANLQFKSLRLNYDAYLRTQATIQAQDIAERLIANLPAATRYTQIEPPVITPDCNANSCSPTQLSAYDLDAWRSTLARLLPSGVGTITKHGVIYTITINWNNGVPNNPPGSVILTVATTTPP